MPFYIRDLRLQGVWYLQGLLEPILCGYQGPTVLECVVNRVQSAPWCIFAQPQSAAEWPELHFIRLEFCQVTKKKGRGGTREWKVYEGDWL